MRRLVLLASSPGVVGRLHPPGGPPLALLMGRLLFVVSAVPLAALLLLVGRPLVLPLLPSPLSASPAGVILCVAPLAARALWVAWLALAVVLAAQPWALWF